MSLFTILYLILLCVFLYFIHVYLDKSNAHSVAEFKKNSKCYVINLEKNVDRLKLFTDSYLASDLNVLRMIRFNAVNGRTIDLQKYVNDTTYNRILRVESDRQRLYHYELTRGAVGCFLSHMEIYKRLILDDEADYYMVFEDDVLIPKKCINNMERYISNAPKDWDILLFGTSLHETTHNYLMYKKVRYFWGMYSYVISKSGARKFLAKMERLKTIRMQIDSMMSMMAENGMLNVYMKRIGLFRFQPGAKTDIQIPVKEMYGIDPFSYPDLEER